MSEYTILDREVLYQQFSGLTRLLTPAGGGLVREYADQLAATTGNIEIGISYNCAVNSAGVWQGRDIADVCWLEKWSDTGSSKEFWFSGSGVAGSVPVWVNLLSINGLGLVEAGSMSFRNSLISSGGRQYNATAGLAAYVIGASSSINTIVTPAAALGVTLPVPAGDGDIRRITFGAATTVTWTPTAPATSAAQLKTVFAAGDEYQIVYNSVAGTPAGSPATSWLPA